MYKVIAILLLAAHVGAFTAPSLAEAGTPEPAPMSHCVPTVGQTGASVVQASQDGNCDACEMPDCVGTASCGHATVAIVSMSSVDFAPLGVLASHDDGSSDVANLLHTPLAPPPRA